MNKVQQSWYAYSLPDCPTLCCAVCKNEVNLLYPTVDHHPRICPACGVECAFLNWKGRIVQIVIDDAPRLLAEGICWAQKHFDELEYVELICALEEISEAMNGEAAAVSNQALPPTEAAVAG
jgi:RNA polymerase subunit RPABC4/transcription elongation factor Spt4